MNILGNKKVVVITGSVWTGSRSAPRKMLVKDGVNRPAWFTTARGINDAHYNLISEAEYHLSKYEGQLFAHIEYGGNFIGIMQDDFEACLAASKNGVLVVGPPEIAAQVATHIPQATIFVFKDMLMELSDHLKEADQRGQIRRIDVDVLKPGAWSGTYKIIQNKLGLS